jgi:hypothetical protein
LSSNNDTLKIPIEIKTEDLDEIRALINEISQAENDLRSLKATPRKGRGSGDQSSRSAFTPSEDRDNRGGIFGNREGPATPSSAKDKKSATPYQRESEFAKLQNQVNEVQQKQGSDLDAIQSGVGAATQGLGFAQMLGQGTKGLMGVASMASKAFLPLAIATSVIEIVKGVLDKALAPGGPLDRRFKRVVSTEMSSASSLEKKAKINQGFLVIRTQVYPNLRGEAGTGSSLRNLQTFDLGTSNSMLGMTP